MFVCMYVYMYDLSSIHPLKVSQKDFGAYAYIH